MAGNESPFTFSQMALLIQEASNSSNGYADLYGAKNPRDFKVQLILSVALGVSAFLAFCVLRPRWSELYAARKQRKNAAARLPELPDSLFGWMPVLWRITDEEILASAGLDAFAFLTFFSYAIKFLSVVLFFALAIILPVNGKFDKLGYPFDEAPKNSTDTSAMVDAYSKPKDGKKNLDNHYLWMYVIFTYFFTVLALYLLVKDTKKIIHVRQGYLGSQSTITDRTLRLSGIPPDMRSEEKIREFVESLNIGQVDNIMLCRDWSELDDLVKRRMECLRRLEEAWTTYLGPNKLRRNGAALPTVQPPPPPISRLAEADGENTQLLSAAEIGEAHVAPADKERPTKRIWYGPLNIYQKKVDAIDYFEEKLRRYDEKIISARKKEYTPTPLAFVTMESVAACQMAVQAILDPTPGQLLASLAPAPADVVWENTYLSRSHRMFRSWSIMVFIGLLTIFWAALLVPVAGLLDPQTLAKVLPGLEGFLSDHKVLQSLLTSSLPTAFLSIMAIIVPFLYAYLSSLQGMTSQTDVELSVISKNYFFTFFSLFVIFTSLGTFFKFYGLFESIREVLKDTTNTALALARSVQGLIPFYTDLIILQAIGLFPFRLLEFGVVAMYPVYMVAAKTPRDYAEVVQPPVFNYGFYLPPTLLIFTICTVYSILPSSWLVVLFGLVYFSIGRFIYKYQLLYAMDHSQHSTAKSWPMICNRVITGLVVFQIVMVGFLALKTALTRSTLVIPALIGTIWFSSYFAKTYVPLMNFIALRSVERTDLIRLPTPTESRWDLDTNHGRSVDNDPGTGLRYINPNLYEPLEKLWVDRALINGGENESLDS